MYLGYSAYVREMNIWASYVDELLIVAPLSNKKPSAIHLPYSHDAIRFYKIPAMGFISLKYSLKTLLSLPYIIFQIYKAMRVADHIHLRCPGTIGLMGCFVQMLFPKKPKTAKYAGNWDPKAKQPFSYRLQKKLLSNSFFTRNMQVLVYGDWGQKSKNVRPFFTATYASEKVSEARLRAFKPSYHAMFVGTLSVGKMPLYSLQLVAALRKKGYDFCLDVYGDGEERRALENQIAAYGLEQYVTLHGNQTSHVLEKAYKKSDFMILPSKSEGWPKAVAEAMFWGCIPIVTSISCVPWMLANGSRGILISLALEKDVAHIIEHLKEATLMNLSKNAQDWSHTYTLDAFKVSLKELLNTAHAIS